MDNQDNLDRINGAYCRHGAQCKNCKLWGCQDDEILNCDGCFDDILCYKWILSCGIDINQVSKFRMHRYCKECYNYKEKCKLCWQKKGKYFSDSDYCYKCCLQLSN